VDHQVEELPGLGLEGEGLHGGSHLESPYSESRQVSGTPRLPAPQRGGSSLLAG
jgi:hypothetical protein